MEASNAQKRRTIVLAITLVLVGCGLNNVSLEFLVRADDSAASVITFAQFLVIALEGFIIHLEFPSSSAGRRKEKAEDEEEEGSQKEGKKKRNISFLPSFLPRLKPNQIPFIHYAAMVTIFFMIANINNAALGFHISLPLHMVFRSGSLISTAVLGHVFFHKRYTKQQYVAAVIVTVGIITATLASAQQKSTQAKVPFHMSTFLIGITMLLAALLLSSVLGLYQEWAYIQFQQPGKEKPHRETMFYSHALALPFFVFLVGDMKTHIDLWNTMEHVTIPGTGTSLSVMWVYLFANIVTQYICIRGVFLLTGNLSSLSTTLVISIRKFISLLVSVNYFGNPFTVYHWVGTALVFGGTFLYTTAPKPTAPTPPKTTNEDASSTTVVADKKQE